MSAIRRLLLSPLYINQHQCHAHTISVLVQISARMSSPASTSGAGDGGGSSGRKLIGDKGLIELLIHEATVRKLVRENKLLKRAVLIQNQRLKKYERAEEEHLKQVHNLAKFAIETTLSQKEQQEKVVRENQKLKKAILLQHQNLKKLELEKECKQMTAHDELEHQKHIRLAESYAKRASDAIKRGLMAIGLTTREGVLLAVEKPYKSPLVERSYVEKLMKIDDHIGCAMCGLIAEGHTLVEHARVKTKDHMLSYGVPMTVEFTTKAICDFALRFDEGDLLKPSGVTFLIAGHDEHGPSLYYIDASRRWYQCNAKAIGSGSEGADSSLEELYNKYLTFAEAETLALSILKQVMGKVTPNNVDMAKVDPLYHQYTPSEIDTVINRL